MRRKNCLRSTWSAPSNGPGGSLHLVPHWNVCWLHHIMEYSLCSPCSPLHKINNSSTFSYVGCLICCKRQNIHSVCTGGRFPARDVCRAVKPRKRKGRVQGCVSLRCDKQLLFLPTFHFFLHERCKKTTP